MSSFDTDIFVSGAGIAGMVLGASLAAKGFRVTVADPDTPPDSAEAEGSDLRSTAYLEPSRRIFETAGLWDDLAPHATPLRALRVIDTDGWPPRMGPERTFRPGDLDLTAFGMNVPNWRARLVLAEALGRMDGVDLRFGTGFAAMHVRDDRARVELTDGSVLTAALVVGADGRASPVRAAAGIEVDITRYAQKALAFAVTHDVPHQNVSTEIYNAGGAFTTVPLADHDDRPASAIVWMNDGPHAVALSEMDDAAFHEHLNHRSLSILGPMRRATPLRVWPIVTQSARDLVGKRVALAAEAAHVMPPIGAQGLNTSLQDVAALCEALAGGDPGDPKRLAAYARMRRGDLRLRLAAIDLFNRVCRTDAAPVNLLRRAGLAATHDIAPLRRAIMSAGMGR